ncbi:hypothetical protein [Aeromicrobium sp. CTD01-1L150]|uniref:hypothetical protein n=1 Tax=Aeromicrobium sp. CTD01-1L150 TaxID=3341830 RepID=UPI0035C10F1C
MDPVIAVFGAACLLAAAAVGFFTWKGRHDREPAKTLGQAALAWLAAWFATTIFATRLHAWIFLGGLVVLIGAALRVGYRGRRDRRQQRNLARETGMPAAEVARAYRRKPFSPIVLLLLYVVAALAAATVGTVLTATVVQTEIQDASTWPTPVGPEPWPVAAILYVLSVGAAHFLVNSFRRSTG